MIRKFSVLFCLFISLTSCIAGNEAKPPYFVPIEKVLTRTTGRYEKQKECISFSNPATAFGFVAPENEFYIWIEETSKDSLQCNWFVMELDYKLHDKIQLKPGKHMYKITVQKNQFIKLIKATEAFVGEVRIYGLQLHQPYVAQEFIISYQDDIQFIGNSITCGYGNMVSIQPPPAGNPLTGFHAANENAYQSYAMQTARLIDAEPTLVSFSGKGMYRNFDGDTNETLPKIYDRIHLQSKKSALWNHEWHAPEIIVINLGTNDYYGESQNKPLNDSVFVQTYIQFVDKLVVLYPTAKIICVNSPMLNDAWPAGKMCWSRLQESVKKVQQYFEAKGNRNIYRFSFASQTAPYGEDYHPSLATHTKMAEELSTFIQTVVNQ
ncbi:MAG: SGNH/GDSL hydrolase family protein [Cytophaga sp.]|uniref:SGNH/GDSL hydrolase family protein n=1 Tax=Cytophaga sp. TaxID=29535 RepID=UPI003F7DE88B